MSQRKIRYGLIGCGEIAMHSLKAIQESPEVCEIIAVQDVAEALAKDAGTKNNVPWFTDVTKLLALKELDAVVISTPHFLHAPLTIQAAQAGKHVACEKPIACTLEQSDAMIAACKAAGVLLTINYVLRYDEMLLKLRELLQSGAIGEIIRFQAHAAADKPESYWSGGYTGRNKSDWRQSKEKSGGGVLIMNLIHDLDRIHWVTGLKPVRVYAEVATHCTPVEVEDNISVVARYANGAIGSVDAMSCARGRDGLGQRLYGTHGQIVIQHPLKVFTTKEGIPGLKPNEWTTFNFNDEEWGADQRRKFFAHFAQSIASGAKTCDVTGEAARESLAFCLAAYESGQKQAPVNL